MSYEVFLKIHFGLGIGAAITLWVHLGNRTTSITSIYVLVGFIMLAVNKIGRIITMIYSNWSLTKGWTTAQVVKGQDIVELLVELPRSRSIRPGQFVYLWAPSVSRWSFLQSHPLSVAWWDGENQSEKATSLALLIRPMAGFSNHLYTLREEYLRVTVDGPYGIAVPTDRHGTIVLFASGIGIAAQLPLIKQALLDIQACRTSLRRVSLVWQIDNESK